MDKSIVVIERPCAGDIKETNPKTEEELIKKREDQPEKIFLSICKAELFLPENLEEICIKSSTEFVITEFSQINIKTCYFDFIPRLKMLEKYISSHANKNMVIVTYDFSNLEAIVKEFYEIICPIARKGIFVNIIINSKLSEIASRKFRCKFDQLMQEEKIKFQIVN